MSSPDIFPDPLGKPAMQAEDKAAVVARAGVVVVGVAALIYGIYLLRNLLGFLGTTLGHLPDEALGWDSIVPIIGALLGPVLLLATGLVLLRKSDSIVRKYFSRPVLRTEVVVYRTALAVMGLFFITIAFTDLLALVANLAVKLWHDPPVEFEVGLSYFWPWAVKAFVNLCVGLYLFIGAPKLLGWHLKRCDATDDRDDAP